MIRIVVFALVLVGGVAIAADPTGVRPASSPAREQLSAAQIDRLVAELDSDSYQARRQATRTLAEQGAAAVPRVLAAAQGRSLETTARAIEVLKYLGMSPDDVTEEAAYAALEQLAALRAPSASTRATAALHMLKESRQDRTIARIRDLGGNVSEPYSPTVLAGGRFRVMARGGAGVMFIGPGMVESVEGDAGTIAITIDAAKWKPGREGLRVLRKLSTITQLVLEGKEVDDGWVSELASIASSELQLVTFKRTSVTDKSLAHISKWSSLTSLDFMHTPVTDAAVSEIAKLKKLQAVRLYGTRVTHEAANRLNAILSNPDGAKAPEPAPEGEDFPVGASRRVATIVDRRGGALLGVSGSLGEEGCEINSVSPESAAEKAGIRQGDTIVKFDGKAVKNFTELTTAISDKAGGEKVKIEISREGKRTTVEVTLGEW
jgi:hypothetical protein